MDSDMHLQSRSELEVNLASTVLQAEVLWLCF